MTSTPKRRRVGSVGTHLDLDITPRPQARSLASSSASNSRATSETGSVAGSSSSKRQMMSLRLGKTGVEYQLLDNNTVPEMAKTLFSTITEIGRTHDIIPCNLQQTIAQELENRNRGEDIQKWRYCFKPEGTPDTLPGRIPSFDAIERVLRAARACEKLNHEEAGWNLEVHAHLLNTIFRDPITGESNDFDTISCTTARPHREFKPILSTAKMIDLCICASLDDNKELEAAIIDFCTKAPTLSINHTDFQPIQFRPIILSIETKKPDASIQQAQLQIGTWHAAQWAFLQWAIGEKLLEKRLSQGLGEGTTDKEQEEFEREKIAALSKLGFIPGIIVHGSQWLLVLSTYDNGKTTLWSGWPFGTTKGEMEIYAIIAGVRELTAWARETYLPWFKENILTLAPK
ncbi:hypothetical protein V8C37DRAFT_413729 [Trichoderma ceciliae]